MNPAPESGRALGRFPVTGDWETEIRAVAAALSSHLDELDTVVAQLKAILASDTAGGSGAGEEVSL